MIVLLIFIYGITYKGYKFNKSALIWGHFIVPLCVEMSLECCCWSLASGDQRDLLVSYSIRWLSDLKVSTTF